jgi:exodeoxyribonuclease-3
MAFKVATWNVNSLRVRLQQVLAWLNSHQPDILALQETKVTDELFPLDAFQEAGHHVIFSGQKTYNGVAIISKKPLTAVQQDVPNLNQHDRRLLGASLGSLRIWNIYVPNGESVQSEKYQYKLSWLTHLRNFLENELQQHPQLLLLGDFNIAPEARDVYDPLSWEGQVLFSEPEKEKLQQLLQLGLEDCFRLHNHSEKNYTWWDYRLNAFQRNRGLRIDLMLASRALAKKCLHCSIDKTPRGWERPSDHTPVVGEFEE